MTMPNFLIIGAYKSGTTSLYHYLKQHPQVYMSPLKETNFFALEGERLNFCGPGDRHAPIMRCSITNLEVYHQQFQDVSHERAIGEASPLYLYSTKAPDRIRHYIAHAKLVAILRHPVDRAYSNFLDLREDDREPLTDFVQALHAGEERQRNNWSPFWHYQQTGMYSTCLKRYFERFDPAQIRVYLHEEFLQRPLQLIQNLFRFLEVDETFIPNMSVRHNVSLRPRSRVLYRLFKRWSPRLIPARFRWRIQRILTVKPPPLAPAIRRHCTELYRDDILNLQDLIQRDLSHWLVEEMRERT